MRGGVQEQKSFVGTPNLINLRLKRYLKRSSVVTEETQLSFLICTPIPKNALRDKWPCSNQARLYISPIIVDENLDVDWMSIGFGLNIILGPRHDRY